MTDLEGKVLFSISGGTIRNTFLKLTKNKRSKRNKVAPGVLTELAKKVKDQMQILSLNSVEVRSKVSFRYLVRFFLTQLNYWGVKITEVKVIIPFVHNGVRARKLKRT